MKLALGTVQFGIDYGIANNEGKVSFNEAESILVYAAENDIKMLDTAPGYGKAENIIGQITRNLKINFDVISKTPPMNNVNITEDSLSELEKTVDASLTALNTNNLKALLTHGQNDFIHKDADKLYKKMLTLKEQGVIENIGSSIYAPEQLQIITQRYDIDYIQLPNNILDQRFNSPHIIKLLNEKEIKVFARSAYLQGLLLISIDELPEQFLPMREKLIQLAQFAKDNNKSIQRVCLEYLQIQDHIDYIVLGIQSKQQLSQAIDCLKTNINIPKNDFTLFSCNNENFIDPSKWKTK